MKQLHIFVLSAGSLVLLGAPPKKVTPAASPVAAKEAKEEIKVVLENATMYTGNGQIEIKELGTFWGKKFQPYCEVNLTFLGKFKMETLEESDFAIYLVRGDKRIPQNRGKFNMVASQVNHPFQLPPWKQDLPLPWKVPYQVSFPVDGVDANDWDGWTLEFALEKEEKALFAAQTRLDLELWPKGGKRPPLKWE